VARVCVDEEIGKARWRADRYPGWVLKFSEVTFRMDDRRDGVGFVFGLLVGALVGASIAVILAPQSGAETREGLRSKASELRGKAGELMDELKDDAGEWAEKGKQVIGKAFNKGTDAQRFTRYAEESGT